MDPQDTLSRWFAAVMAGERETANEHYEALRAWLERGGFEPNWSAAKRKLFFSYNPVTGELPLEVKS